MIKTVKGRTQAEGTGLELMADLACIIESLLDKFPKFMVESVIEMAMQEAAENSEPDELVEAVNKLEEILKAKGII